MEWAIVISRKKAMIRLVACLPGLQVFARTEKDCACAVDFAISLSVVYNDHVGSRVEIPARFV